MIGLLAGRVHGILRWWFESWEGLGWSDVDDEEEVVVYKNG